MQQGAEVQGRAGLSHAEPQAGLPPALLILRPEVRHQAEVGLSSQLTHGREALLLHKCRQGTIERTVLRDGSCFFFYELLRILIRSDP